VSQVDRAIALVAPYCDIEDRLRVIPPSAQVRGIFLKSMEQTITRCGLLAQYREYFPTDSYSSFPFYPIGELLIRCACGGALLTSPERVHDGMVLVTKGNAEAFMSSLLGRVMLRALSRDPFRLLQQAMAARRQSFTYGHWELKRHSGRELEVAYTDEFWWIESAALGSAQGTFDACGLNVRIRTELKDRLNGSTFFSW
jgi:uncharacterized protein (TIGR02265 family)